MLEKRNLKLREVNPHAQGCRAWRWQDLNLGLASSKAHVLFWKRLLRSHVNFPSPTRYQQAIQCHLYSHMRKLCGYTGSIVENSGSCHWLSFPLLQWVGPWPWNVGEAMALDRGRPGLPPPVPEMGPSPSPTNLLPYIRVPALGLFLISKRTMLRLLSSLLLVALGKTPACYTESGALEVCPLP